MDTALGTRVHHFAVQLHLSLQRGRKRHPQRNCQPQNGLFKQKPATLAQELYTEVASLHHCTLSTSQHADLVHNCMSRSRCINLDAGESDQRLAQLDNIRQGLVTVPFWEYWTSPEKVAIIDHIPNGWVMFNGDI
jgi:hypothetical protein